MRIAQVAPLAESVPPRAYGGTERVVSYLTEALVDAGHDVTLFASGDSITNARLVPVVPRSLRTDPARPQWFVHHTIMIQRVFALAARFDVIHFHIDCLHYPMAERSRTPCVTTMHGRLDHPDLRPLHDEFPALPLVSISDAQRRPLSNANWCATVHHGLPAPLYRFEPQPEGYFAFVGRISPEKRVDRAIDIAIACGVPLVVAAKVDAMDQDYFDREIRHRMNHPLVHFLGEVDDRRKQQILGGARALLFPIDWPEPFGLVVIEALACGTPVIAFRHGSVPELLQHGVSGYVVDRLDEAIDAARAVDRIARRRCREAFESRFTAARMASRYVQVYDVLAQTLGRRRGGWPGGDDTGTTAAQRSRRAEAT